MTQRSKDPRSDVSSMRVGFIVAPGFEESEVTEPRGALDRAGAKTVILAPEGTRVRSWHRKDWGAEYPVDVLLEDARADELDALVLPGGVFSSDHLRGNDHARALVQRFMDGNRPVAAICHGPWLLVDTESARGRQLTSHPRIANDLKNAGAEWIDAEVVVDHNLVTSRKPEDLPAFNEKMLEIFAQAAERRKAATS